MRKVTAIFSWILPAMLALSLCAYASPAHANKPPPKSNLASNGANGYFITMNPMILPIVNEHGVRENVSVVVALEVKDQETMEKVNNMVPKLGDAYLRALYGRLDTAAYRTGDFLDLGKLKNRLVLVTNTVLGSGMVDNVLIQGVNQRQFD